MAHLGTDVAAFVDGQLSPAASGEARRHLQECDRCRAAVVAQERLKSRMSAGHAPEPPAALLATLSGLAAAPPPPEPLSHRVLGAKAVRAGVAVVGASIAVLVAAYLIGGHEERDGDRVLPAFDGYVADFLAGWTTPVESAAAATSVAFVPLGTRISERRLDELTAAGWPCHRRLADLERISGHWVHADDAVALNYTNGSARLQLVEQAGSLDTDALTGFEQRTVRDARVWVRDGVPRVVSWDADGVVYTLVTDADDRRLAETVAELPTRPALDLTDRIGAGLTRLTSWAAAA